MNGTGFQTFIDSLTEDVDEPAFVLKGILDVFVEDDNGNRVTRRLGPWDCVSCPPGGWPGIVRARADDRRQHLERPDQAVPIEAHRH